MGTDDRAEHGPEQFARTIGHQMLLGEVGCRVDQRHQLDNPGDLVQVAHRRVQRAQQINGDGPRGILALCCSDVFTQLTHPYFSIAFGDVAAQEHQLTGLHKRYVGGGGDGNRGQGDVKFLQLGINIHESSFLLIKFASYARCLCMSSYELCSGIRIIATVGGLVARCCFGFVTVTGYRPSGWSVQAVVGPRGPAASP